MYSAARDPLEMPLDSEREFAYDFGLVMDDPANFSDVIVLAEVIQCVATFAILAAVTAPKRPLPPGWFQFSVTGDKNNAAEDVEGKVVAREEKKKKRGNGLLGGMMWGNLLERGGGLDDGEEERGAGTDAAAAAEKERSVSSSRAKKNKAVAAQKKRSAEWLGEAGNSVIIVWLAMLGITALSYALGLRGDDVGSEGGGVIEKAFKAGPRGAWSIFLTTVVLAPIIEETVFRGFLLPSLTKYMPTWNALAVTTVVFALVHDHNTGDTLQLLCVGAVAGSVYCRTRNLAASVLVHASFNLGVLFLFSAWTNSG